MTRLSVVGAGNCGRLIIQAIKQRERLQGDVVLVGVAEPDSDRREYVLREYGVPVFANHRDILDKCAPDAVCVATPDHDHYEPVMDALEFGSHVLVQKPLATDVGQASRMAERARQLGLLLQVDFHKRYDPYHIDLRSRLQSGELGTCQYGYFWMEDILRVGTDMIGQPHWNGQGSPAWFLGAHMIDLSCWLLGFPRAKQVWAQGFRGKLSSLGFRGFDAVKATVKFENGVSITYDCSVALPNNNEAVGRQGVKLVGSDGYMVIDSQFRGARGCSTENGMCTPNMGMAWQTESANGDRIVRGYLYDSIIDFVERVNCVRNGTPVQALPKNYADAEQGLEITRIVSAIHQSISTGECCDLNDCTVSSGERR